MIRTLVKVTLGTVVAFVALIVVVSIAIHNPNAPDTPTARVPASVTVVAPVATQPAPTVPAPAAPTTTATHTSTSHHTSTLRKVDRAYRVDRYARDVWHRL